MSEPITTVDFHFDVMCPWAYQASLWMRDVRDQLKLNVGWRFFSLEEINRAEGKKHPWEREWSYGWSMMRVGALLRRTDPALVDRWYYAAGTALHVDGRKPHRPEVAEELVAGLGLDPALVRQAIDDPSTHDDVRADHDRVTGLGGWGVPTLVFPASAAADGAPGPGRPDHGRPDHGRPDHGRPDHGRPNHGERALFGPVLIDPPSGEAAVRLWRLLTGWLEFPALYEVQRPKSQADLHAIGTTFRPYLEARDWITIQKETP
jgi:2-hydroxychromene-2-carboxylate isomerase